MSERVGFDELELVGRMGEVAPLSDQVLGEARATLRAAVALEGLGRDRQSGALEHGGAARRPERRLRARPTHGRRRARTAFAMVATGTAAAAVALVAVSGLGAGGAAPGHRAASRALEVDRPLVELADYIQANSAQPTGDATLVLRTQSYPNSPSATGADLYTDSGQYFYAPTESGLPAAIAANADQGGGMFAREVKAAEDAATGSVATAAHEMATAPFPGGVWPAANPAATSKVAAARAAQAAAAAAAGEPTPTPAASSSAAGSVPNQGQVDNYLWMDSLDALSAGAGNPQVRTGVLRILATLPEVTVTDTTTNGQATVTLTAKAPALPANYQEALTIDASTGVPVAFAGGTPGQPPSVTVAYQVSRVTVADIAAGRF